MNEYLKLVISIFIFSIFRIIILCVLENLLDDPDNMIVSIILSIFVVFCIIIINYIFSTITISTFEKILNALVVNSIATCITLIISTILDKVPFLIIPLMVPYVSTIISGIIWGISAAFSNGFITLSSSIKFLTIVKMIGLIILIIFNYMFGNFADLINIKKIGMKGAKKLVKHKLSKVKNYGISNLRKHKRHIKGLKHHSRGWR